MQGNSLKGKMIRVCHKKARVQEHNQQDQTVEVVLSVGGVAGNVLVVTEEYAQNNLVE